MIRVRIRVKRLQVVSGLFRVVLACFGLWGQKVSRVFSGFGFEFGFFRGSGFEFEFGFGSSVFRVRVTMRELRVARIEGGGGGRGRRLGRRCKGCCWGVQKKKVRVRVIGFEGYRRRRHWRPP